jgi:hypothetical protein
MSGSARNHFPGPIQLVAAPAVRDAGQSPWWLLTLSAPVGGLVIIAVLCAMPSADVRQAQAATWLVLRGR